MSENLYNKQAVAETVEAERERCWQAVAGVLNRAWKRAESSHPVWADLVNCRDALLPPDSQPPAAEPMTVARLVARLDSGAYDQDCNDCGSVHNLKADLQALVDAETRRLATLIRNCELGGSGVAEPDRVADQILRSAGLIRQPEPTPAAPMTIKALLGYIAGAGFGEFPDLEAKLEALVKEQARKDAAIVDNSIPYRGRSAIAAEIREAAGLG